MLLIRPRTILLAFACALILTGLGALFGEYRRATTEAQSRIERRLSELEQVDEIDGNSLYSSENNTEPVISVGKLEDWPVWFIVSGALFALLVVLWNSSTLDAGWLASVGFAFKGLAFVLVLVLLQWFAMWSTQEKSRLAVIELAEKKALRATDDRNAERKRRDSIVSNIVARLGEGETQDDKLLAIRSAVPEILKGDAFGAELLQLLHGVAIDAFSAPDPEQEEFGITVGKLIFDGVALKDQYPKDQLFIRAMKSRLDLLNQHSSPPCGDNERLQILIYNRCLNHLKEDEVFGTVLTEIGSLTLTALARSGEVYVEQIDLGSNQSKNTVSLTEIASVAAYTAVDQIKERGVRWLEQLDPSEGRLERAISLLPSNTTTKIPSRIYFYVPKGLDMGSAPSELLGVIREKFVEDVILPEPRVVEKIGAKAAKFTQVRYYRNTDPLVEEVTYTRAHRIAEILREIFISGVEVVPITPTTSDRTVSRGLENKFEVWVSESAKSRDE